MTAGKASKLALLWHGNGETGAEATHRTTGSISFSRRWPRTRRPRGVSNLPAPKREHQRGVIVQSDG
jgi:hypothetical protein